jgi:hypothetical protein
VIALHFYKESFVGEVMTNSKDFNPVAIASAHITEGVHVLPVNGNWSKMINARGKIATFKSSI